MTTEREENVSQSSPADDIRQQEIHPRTTSSEFLENTSLHGCKSILLTRAAIGKCVWGLLVLAMTCLCFQSLISLFIKYYQYKVVTRLTKEFREDITFPTVKVCKSTTNRHLLLRRNFTNKEHRFSQNASDMYQDMHNTDKNDAHQIGFSPSQAMTEVSDMIKLVIFKDRILPITSRNVNGNCYTFNTPSPDKDSAVERVSTTNQQLFIVADARLQTEGTKGYTRTVFKVFINDAKYRDPRHEESVTIDIGSWSIIKLQRKEMKFLGHPYNSRGTDCVDVDASDFVNPLSWFKYYTRVACLTECRNKPFKDMCNCTSHFPYFGRAANNSSCPCPHICQMVSYDTQIKSDPFIEEVVQFELGQPESLSPDYTRKNIALLSVGYKSMIVDKAVHEAELELSDILAKLGGSLGLFLGASIITATELIQFLSICIFSLVSKLLRTRVYPGKSAQLPRRQTDARK